MSHEDIKKFLRRANEERQLAAATRNRRAAEEHRDLADKYEAVAKAYLRLI